MNQLYYHLFVGDQRDEQDVNESLESWAVVHAAKEPYHRRMVGYSGRTCGKDHPEYLWARRDTESGPRLALNLIDADDPSYIPKELIDEALSFMRHHCTLRMNVLVHCNQGGSRGPVLAMLFLRKFTDVLPDNFEEAERVFEARYPRYAPANGMREFARTHWDHYGLRE